ncbi:Nephrocystin-3 [Paramuricea clavata]|uniref:Kinesin light chain n=1 Tax=Paramuricea clavata TaxID=317549 RepID=A0A7D9J724_PARCT|nr:Nephrocystin-3 [Paramuricea clavata]
MGNEVWNNGQIILTIQNRTAVPSDSPFTKHISVSCGMKIQECRQLLFLLSGTDVNDRLSDEVAEKLDHQPLAIAAAAVYFKKVNVKNCCPKFSWQDYLEKLKCKREVTEEQLLKTSSAYQSTMSAAVSLAVAKSAENSLILHHTFDLFSLISFEPLPLDIITKYIQQLDQNCDKEEIYLAVKDCSLFLLTEIEDREVRLHRVVHDVAKSLSNCKQTETKDYSQCDTANRAKARRRVQNVAKALYCFKVRDDQIKVIPHLKAFNSAVTKLGPEHTSLHSNTLAFEKREICKIYLFFGKTLHHFYAFKNAVEFHNMNLQISRGFDAQNYECSILNDLGLLYQKMGDYEQAKDYHQQALAIKEKQLSPDNVNVALSYSNLGTVYRAKDELDQAKDYHERALAIKKKQLSPDHVDVARSYSNLGTVYRAKGELDQAKDYHERALAMKEKQLSPDHVDVARSYSNLGTVYRAKGELDQAKDYHERALAIKEKQLSPDHVDVARSYSNLGRVYRAKGELDQAKDYHERALAIKEKQLSPDHVDVARSYSNLGTVYRAKGELDQAKDYHERALAIKEKQLSPDHVDVARSYSNLGTVYCAKGELDQAKDYHERALAIKEKQLSPDHVDVARSYSNLGTVYRAKGELDQAKDYHERALEIREKQLSPDHVDLARSYSNLGAVYHAKGEIDQAKDYYERALAIRKKATKARRC